MTAKEVLCPLCKALLVSVPGVGQWYCPECKRGFTGEDLESGVGKVFCSAVISREAQDWARGVALDENLWFENAFDFLPSIIAHEYHRLRGLFSDGFIFGTILQIKDVFEVIIKFCVSVALALAMETGRGENVLDVLKSFFEKPLSLGHWMEALRNLQEKSVQSQYLDMVPFLLFPKILQRHMNDIVSWRNEEIGHGALSMPNDVAMRRDIEEKLGWLKEVMEHCLETYSGYQLLSENLVFMGWQAIKSLHEDEGKIHREEVHPIFLKGNKGNRINLFPFVRLQTCSVCRYKDIFFFYSMKGRNHSVFLDYAYGHKIKRSISMEKELRYLQQKLSVTPIDGDTVESKVIKSRLDDLIQKIRLADFRKPVYVVNWLKDAMKEHDKGIFLLQMAAGMGKTVFVNALDPFSLNKLKLSGKHHIVCYYIDNVYRFKLAPFTFELNDRIRRNLQENLFLPLEISPPSLSMKRDDTSASKVFAKWLTFYVTIMQRYLGYDGILIVIDALDEIPANELSDRNILDFIPRHKDLPAGAYVLLTSRTSEEVHDGLKTRIKHLDVVASLNVTPNDAPNRELLCAYLEKELKDVFEDNNAPRSLIPEILEKGENTFLYVSSIKDLILGGNLNGSDLVRIPAAESLYDKFLATVERVYPEKFLQGIRNILLALATAFEPITLDELAYLVGEDRITFRFLGYLKDIKNIIRVKRNVRGNLFSIAHNELAVAVKDRWNKAKENILKLIILQGLSDISEGDCSPGPVYFAAHVLDYLKTVCDKSIARTIVDEELAIDLCEMGCFLIRDQKSVYGTTRAINIFNGCIKIMERLNQQGMLVDENVLARAYLSRGNALMTCQDIDSAIEDYNRATEIRERLNQRGMLLDENDLARAYVNRGNALRARQEIDLAIEDYNRAIEIRGQQSQQGILIDENDLARVYVNRGNALRARQETNLALADYNQALRIRTRLNQQGILPNENDLAIVYMQLASCLGDLYEIGSALEYYNRAIKIMEHLNNEGKLSHENNLAGAYVGRGAVLKALQEVDSAIKDYNRAIEIRERLNQEGKLLYKNDLARAYVDRGNALRACQEIDLAVVDYNRAIKIMEHLKNEGKLVYENDLAGAYVGRGTALKALQEVDSAIEDYNRAIEIRKRLNKKGMLLDENDLARAHLYRGNAQRARQKTGLALEDYNEAIKIMERLYRNKKLLNESNLAGAYVYRGIAFAEYCQIDTALSDCNKAVEIMERLRGAKKLQCENDLSEVYMCRGNVFRVSKKLDSAIQDYNHAIKIRERLKREGKLLNDNDLALAYMNRGYTMFDLQNVCSALKDYMCALRIRERMVKKGKYWLRGDLFIAYQKCFSVLKHVANDIDQDDLSVRALSIAKEALRDGKMTEYAFNELKELAQFAANCDFLSQKHRLKWREIVLILESMKD